MGIIWRGGLLSLINRVTDSYLASCPLSFFLERNCERTGGWGGLQGSHLPGMWKFSFFLQCYLLSISFFITVSTPCFSSSLNPQNLYVCVEGGINESGLQGRVAGAPFPGGGKKFGLEMRRSKSWSSATD